MQLSGLLHHDADNNADSKDDGESGAETRGRSRVASWFWSASRGRGGGWRGRLAGGASLAGEAGLGGSLVHVFAVAPGLVVRELFVEEAGCDVLSALLVGQAVQSAAVIVLDDGSAVAAHLHEVAVVVLIWDTAGDVLDWEVILRRGAAEGSVGRHWAGGSGRSHGWYIKAIESERTDGETAVQSE